MATRRYRPDSAWEHALSQVDCRRHLILVSGAGEALTGWCRLFPEANCPGGRSASLGIGLLPGWRDQGIGTRLVRASLEWARSAGLREVHLTTRRDNLRAIHVFDQCGFAPSGGDQERLDMVVVLGED